MSFVAAQNGYWSTPVWTPYPQVWAPPAPQPYVMGYDQYVPAWQPAPAPWGQQWPRDGAPLPSQPGYGASWTHALGSFVASIMAIFRRPPAPAPYAQPGPYGPSPLPPAPPPQPWPQPVPYSAPAPLPQPWPQPVPYGAPAPPPAPFPMPLPAPAPVPVPQPQAAPALPPLTAPLEGFDHNKLYNLSHRTPKYLFARCVMDVPLTGVRDHAGAEQLLRSLMPRFAAAGLQVLDVHRDKILVVTEIGPEWVDVVRGAGSGNPGWWWGSEGRPAPGVVAPPYGPPAPGPMPVPVPVPGPVPMPGLPPLQTVPVRPEYAQVPVNRSSDPAAILSVAQHVRAAQPHLFAHDDRAAAYEIMTQVIGILRAHGYDAHRVVNHPSRPMGDPWRYGSDALVLNGVVYDCYRGIGDPNQSVPQAMDVGRYEPGRARE